MGFKKSLSRFFTRSNQHTVAEREAIRDGKVGAAIGHALAARGYSAVNLVGATMVVAGCTAGGTIAIGFDKNAVAGLLIFVPLAGVVLAIVVPAIALDTTKDMVIPEINFFWLGRLKKNIAKYN